ncbi:MAG: hypothetical protein HC941_17135 [Microcoleus sp. SU_5_3]|nr:hypothetical protein [Microcoleus sp. SU_5_3]
MRQGIDSLPDCGTANDPIAPQLPKHLCSVLSRILYKALQKIPKFCIKLPSLG